MRLFFAIEFNDSLKDYLFVIQQKIKQYSIGGNFSSKDNFHLTLRFIGEQSPSQAEQLKAVLKDTAESFKVSGFKQLDKPLETKQSIQTNGSTQIVSTGNTSEIRREASAAFELKLNRIGKFDRGNKKIIWVGINKSRELEELYHRLESVLLNYGYSKEDRGFNPHITLAREVKLDGFEQLWESIKVNNLSINVNSISLMESKRIDNKLCYVPLMRVKI